MTRKARLSSANTYALYYGCDKANLLTQYDIAIVEPSGHSKDSIQEIKLAGTLVIAYLSVMEIPQWSTDLGHLKSGDLLHLDGEPYLNQEFGNYWVDLRSSRWVDLLLAKAHHLLAEVGYDGLFLDTIGYVESRRLSPKLRTGLEMAATKLVKKLKRCFSEYLLIQNCGLDTLLMHTAEYLDGVCWENPPFNQHSSQMWVDRVLDSLEQQRRTYQLKVFLLVEETLSNAQDFYIARKIAYEKQFLVYYAPSLYTSGVASIEMFWPGIAWK